MARHDIEESGTKVITVKNELDDEFDVEVDYEYYYDYGVLYYPDGSGEPPDWGIEMTDFRSANGDPLPDWVTEELVNDAFEAAVDSGNVV